MDRKFISQATQVYDSIICHTKDDDIEFWYARDLMPLRIYTLGKFFKRHIESYGFM